MTASGTHRLNGLEPDNLLAFLALVGTLRAIGFVQPGWQVRSSWSIDTPPVRPQLHLAVNVSRDTLVEQIAIGLDALAQAHDFGGQVDLNFDQATCRAMLREAMAGASYANRARADLLAALMHDAAIKDHRNATVDPTPLCLLFGQGHQHFLERLAAVPRLTAPPSRGRGKQANQLSAEQCLAEALFDIWPRQDPTPSFRWDPSEDVRYATMAGDPTDPAFKTGTQHGANRLASIGLPVMRMAARTQGGKVRSVVTAGRRDSDGFALAWPIWKVPASLAGLAAMLSHPDLHAPGGLAHLGVETVLSVRRISIGKFMNFTRARALV